jgi:hypothetical protein
VIDSRKKAEVENLLLLSLEGDKPWKLEEHSGNWFLYIKNGQCWFVRKRCIGT